MKKIEIFGPGCPKCAAFYELTQLLLTEKNSLVPVEKVTDAMEMGSRGILSVPALAIDGKVVFSGRVPSKSELYQIFLENGLESSGHCACKGDASSKDCSCGDACDCEKDTKKDCCGKGDSSSKDCSCGDACQCGDSCQCGDGCKCNQEKGGSSCCCCGGKGGALKRILVFIIVAIIIVSAYKFMTSEGTCGSGCNAPAASQS